VWEQANGPIRAGRVVRHRCDNPPCFRLSHLTIGTVADNNRDAMERRRQWSPPALSPTQSWRVVELSAKGWNAYEIAGCFGVSQAAIRRVESLGAEGLAEYLEGMGYGGMDAAPTVQRDAPVVGSSRLKGIWSTPWKPHEWQRPTDR
jgi:hypothetical protein